MIRDIDHVAIAVGDLDEAIERFQRTLGLAVVHREVIGDYGVAVATLETGIELVAATADDSPIARFLERHGEGIHHVAFRVDDIDAALSSLQEKSVELIDSKPRAGKQGSRVAFIHPRSMGRILVELVETAGE